MYQKIFKNIDADCTISFLITQEKILLLNIYHNT